MSDEEWSLKEKDVTLPLDDEEVYWDWFYYKEDIKTLRKKLIDDITENLNIKLDGDDNDPLIQNTINMLYSAYEKEVVRIINKRFGVL